MSLNRREFLQTTASAILSFPFRESTFFQSTNNSECFTYPLARETEHGIETSYQSWLERYTTTDGTPNHNQLRVQMADPWRQEDRNFTVSEGNAYGMLFAASMEDKDTFDRIYNHSTSYFNEDGLMSWRITADGAVANENGSNIPDTSSASDADYDMALALIIAGNTWGESYHTEARILLDAILSTSMVFTADGSVEIKTGNDWGGRINPSYMSPAHFQVFFDFTGDERWRLVLEEARNSLDRIQNHTQATTGLFPDWASLDGVPVEDVYGYDATRVFIRQAMAVVWFCDEHAKGILENANTFFETIDPAEIKDGYTLEGTVVGQYHNPDFVAPVLAASIVSSNPGYQREILSEALRLTNASYFGDSLRLWTLLLLSGKMKA